MNPQFHVQIPRAGLSKCHVVVSVTQQYDTYLSAQDTKRRHHLHPIGFAVYEIPPNMTRLTPAFVTEHVRNPPLYTYRHNLPHTEESCCFFADHVPSLLISRRVLKVYIHFYLSSNVPYFLLTETNGRDLP